jgi:DNA-directed RNA polymerase specialized sigma24 family protein
MTTETIKKLQDALNEVRDRYHALILEEVRNSGRTYREIAIKFGCSEGLVYTVSRLNGISRTQRDEASHD